MNDNHLQFFTATILKWVHVLRDNSYKEVVLDSLKFLVEKGRCEVYAFVIMPNHIHLIWRMAEGHKQSDVQRDFLKFTGQQIRFKLMDSSSEMLKQFEVNKYDRKYQIWQRRPLSVDIYSDKVLQQKLEYIHANPVQEHWSLVKDFTDYPYSSASFYELREERFSFLTHYMDVK